MAEDNQETPEEMGNQGSDNGEVASSLLNKGNVVPAAATALAAAAAGLAVTKGPDLIRKVKGDAEDEAEQLGREGAEGAKSALSQGGPAMLGKAASKLMGGGGTGKGGKTRRLPIQRWTDVAVPVEKAYEQWTKFEEFPKFMHRVLEVKEEEKGKVHWQEKIWFSTREWDAEIVDQKKNDRIAWKTTSGTQHSGVISFHKLDSNLTRVLVTVDFVPTGMMEKMASGLRFTKRAVQSDLARFKAYVELGEAKGLEYSSKPEEMEQHRDDKGEDDSAESDGDENRADASGSDENGETDAERESRQQERESRRKERRASTASA
jgi:uncharacterized membrane protein